MSNEWISFKNDRLLGERKSYSKSIKKPCQYSQFFLPFPISFIWEYISLYICTFSYALYLHYPSIISYCIDKKEKIFCWPTPQTSTIILDYSQTWTFHNPLNFLMAFRKRLLNSQKVK